MTCHRPSHPVRVRGPSYSRTLPLLCLLAGCATTSGAVDLPQAGGDPPAVAASDSAHGERSDGAPVVASDKISQDTMGEADRPRESGEWGAIEGTAENAGYERLHRVASSAAMSGAGDTLDAVAASPVMHVFYAATRRRPAATGAVQLTVA